MKKLAIFALVALTFVGCKEGQGFLDKEPDMRAHIDTKEKVRLLLVSAYTTGNNTALLEFSSDNVIDNNAPDAIGRTRNLLPLDKMYNDIFAWKPVVSGDAQDTPKFLWDAHYSAIAAANEALQAIEQLEAQGINMDSEKGEALLIRAYHHFLLTMVFCQAYRTDELSSKDLGVVYMKVPETTVKPTYTRPNLTETYKEIEKDLAEGLKLVSDEYYSVPKYHFNKLAAHAFAARFYLYTRQWDKVVENANLVLTEDPEIAKSRLFDHTYEHVTCTNVTESQNAWIDPQSPSNLLLNTTSSVVSYIIIPDYSRYHFNGDPIDHTISGAGPCWSEGALTGAVSAWRIGSDPYGYFLAKFLYIFEYTDKVNGYGYVHGITRAFTSDETLLCRAEAKAQLNDLEGAVNDLKIWCEGMNVNHRVMDINADSTVNLTLAKINKFYNVQKGIYQYTPELHNEDMVPGWVITEEQLPVVYACLHMRRIETLHDGLRFQDLKRYGIEITHKQGRNPEDRLVWNDERRAIQLPQEVILAGMEPNPRPQLTPLPAGSFTKLTK